jgi:serine/threonine protein kinase
MTCYEVVAWGDKHIGIIMEFSYSSMGRDWKHWESDEADVWILTKQLSSALNYLHNSHILHGNIKPNNVFSVRKTWSKFVYKLGDFGLTKFLNSDEQVRHYVQFQGQTPIYMAPEVLANFQVSVS